MGGGGNASLPPMGTQIGAAVHPTPTRFFVHSQRGGGDICLEYCRGQTWLKLPSPQLSMSQAENKRVWGSGKPHLNHHSRFVTIREGAWGKVCLGFVGMGGGGGICPAYSLWSDLLQASLNFLCHMHKRYAPAPFDVSHTEEEVWECDS